MDSKPMESGASVEQARIPDARAAGHLRLVRFRLMLVLIGTGFVSIVAGAVLASILAPDPQFRLAAALRSVPLPWLGALVLAFALGCDLILYLARHIVQPAEELERERRHYGELYEAARSHALEDSLTGLGNHRAFHEQFDRQLDEVRRYGSTLAVVVIDLDDFKLINDSAGHAVGDDALTEMSALLRSNLRRADAAFRIGGDEFAVLMPHTQPDEAALVARRLLASCAEPRPRGLFTRGFSFSAGVSGAPGHGRTRLELLAQADEALYDAKREGRTAVHVYDPERNRRPLDEPGLRRASEAVVKLVEEAALTPVYQPIVDLRSGDVVGFEGLVRPTPASGVPDPGTLFSVAEATGRTAELDRLCIQTILRGAVELGPGQHLSLNLSPQTLEAPEFSVALLTRMLGAAGLTPTRVVLELTERQAVQDVDVLRRRLTACQAAGLRVAIDDVGAGNAGLRLLSQIHFDIVKIDLSLIQAGAERQASLDVVRSLSELANRWGASAVAEGVESTRQLRMVRDVGLGQGQGYLLGRPGPTPNLTHVDIDGLLDQSDFESVLGIRRAAMVATA